MSERVAGRELDAEVAEKVMGERRPIYTHGDNALHASIDGRPIRSEGGCWVEVCEYEKGDIPTWVPLPFSTDIAAAWRVVGRFDGFASKRYESDTLFRVTLERAGRFYAAKAATLPLATSLAALRAVENVSSARVVEVSRQERRGRTTTKWTTKNESP